MEQQDKYKIVLIGSANVGKTAIVKRFLKGRFEENEKNTISACLFHHKMNIDGIEIELKIWDTAGQEVFKSIGPLYYKDADAAIAVFDITDQKSLTELEGWIQSYRDYSKSSLVIIAGNKIDKRTDSENNYDEEQNWAKVNKAKELIMTSAFNGEGISELFEICGRAILDEVAQCTEFKTTQPIESPKLIERKKCC